MFELDAYRQKEPLGDQRNLVLKKRVEELKSTVRGGSSQPSSSLQCGLPYIGNPLPIRCLAGHRRRAGDGSPDRRYSVAPDSLGPHVLSGLTRIANWNSNARNKYGSKR